MNKAKDDILHPENVVNEEQISEWGVFYQTLNRLGPRLLEGIHPDLEEWIASLAADTDDFFSWGLHGDFYLWEEGDRTNAVRNALDDWVDNVRRHFGEILGPWSLIPFKEYGISRSKRAEWKVSIDDIRLKLDDQHLTIFIDSVLLEYASSCSSPALLIQAIVTPYAETPEGKIIHALAVPWQMIVRTLKRDWSQAYQIPYEKWEEMIAAAFDLAGYDEVILTPRSGDHGRDVIAIKKGIGAVRIIDSVKAYRPKHLVEYDDVRALAGVLLGDQQASKGILTTTSAFAPGIMHDPFLKQLIPYRLELMDGNALQRWLEDLATQ